MERAKAAQLSSRCELKLSGWLGQLAALLVTASFATVFLH